MKLLNAAVVLSFIPASMAFAADALQAKREMVERQLAEIGSALDMYYADCGFYPLDLKYLTRPAPNCENWGPEPYVKQIENDPWGHSLKYIRRDPQNYELRSLGADGTDGGENDNLDIALPSR
jgi:general secretion pathway protein G